MSWSIAFVGKPENIVKALEENSNKLTGASKDEYDAALPHLIGIVKQNFNSSAEPSIEIVANGHGYKWGPDNSLQQNNLNVSLKGSGAVAV